MMDSIWEQAGARRRHRVAPLLKEREQYLSHLLQRGTSQHRVRSVAAYLIHIIRLMELTTLRKVDLEEIKKAGECWANYRGPHRRRRAGRTAAFCFTNVAKNWFRFHGQLAIPPAPQWSEAHPDRSRPTQEIATICRFGLSKEEPTQEFICEQRRQCNQGSHSRQEL